MSSPNTAEEACSRLSPHLALGTLSTREVIHRLDAAKRLVTQPSARKGYDAFESRLAWRGTMQRFEDEMSIEVSALDPSTDHLRRAGAMDGDTAHGNRNTAPLSGMEGWTDRLSHGGCVHAFAAENRVVEFPDAGDGGFCRVLHAVVGLATHQCVARASIYGL